MTLATETDFSYDSWESGFPYTWAEDLKGDSPYDNLDFHVDLGCGRHKKGRIGVDLLPGPDVDILLDLEVGKLPFADESIRSIITSHTLEHIGNGFIPLMDDIWRVLEPGGIFRVIVPVFPSASSIIDPDHKRLFHEEMFDRYFCEGGIWERVDFATPYTDCRFQILEKMITPLAEDFWHQLRDMRIALLKPSEGT